MLKIRKEQMDIFQQQAEINFVHHVAKQLHNNHAEAVKDVPEDKLYKRVEYGIRCAREYGLTWKNNLRTFVTLMFEIAPDFDSYPVFHNYLTDESIQPNHRMEIILDKTVGSDWKKAREASTKDWPEELQ
jgi:hypothetical protein